MAYRFQYKTWLHILFIAAATLLVYGRTLDVPFYLDDYSSLVDNPVLYDTENIAEFYRYASLRILGYATFWLNFKVHHFHVAGYHIVNIAIHFINGLVIYFLTKTLSNVSLKIEKRESRVYEFLPLFVGLLFIVHPLQTQGVTYIIQRFASLTALFYLLSILFYVNGRIVHLKRNQLQLYTVSVVFFILAFLTKQNSITLPLIIILIEIVFFQDTRLKVINFIVCGFCCIVIILLLLAIFESGREMLSSLDRMTRETLSISRREYFLTQLVVIWKYIAMFFYPVGLHLDHDIPLAKTFTSSVWLSSLAHIVCIGTALLLTKKSPLIAFAILFYYLTHLVESSFIPIRDVMFEHRTYLPNFGLSIISGVVLFRLLQGIMSQWIKICVLCIILIFLGCKAWFRNEVWRDPIELWKDSAIAAPNKARPWNELGKYLLTEGRLDEAIDILLNTEKQKRKRYLGEEEGKGYVPDEEASVNLMMALSQKGEAELAFEVADAFLKRDVKPINRSKMLTNKGNLLAYQKQYDLAEKNYRMAIKAFPKNIMPQNNLGILLMIQGRFDEAERAFVNVLEIDPEFELSREKLKQVRELKK